MINITIKAFRLRLNFKRLDFKNAQKRTCALAPHILHLWKPIVTFVYQYFHHPLGQWSQYAYIMCTEISGYSINLHLTSVWRNNMTECELKEDNSNQLLMILQLNQPRKMRDWCINGHLNCKDSHTHTRTTILNNTHFSLQLLVHLFQMPPKSKMFPCNARN